MSQEEKMEATVDQGDIEAIVGGYHGNPFAVLGPHEIEGGLVIRAFLPQAAEAAVLINDQTIPLTRHHWDGFFVSDNGYELVLILGVASLAFAITGASKLSLDSRMG